MLNPSVCVRELEVALLYCAADGSGLTLREREREDSPDCPHSYRRLSLLLPPGQPSPARRPGRGRTGSELRTLSEIKIKLREDFRKYFSYKLG